VQSHAPVKSCFQAELYSRSVEVHTYDAKALVLSKLRGDLPEIPRRDFKVIDVGKTLPCLCGNPLALGGSRCLKRSVPIFRSY
jgi:hypothetical protein